MKAAFIESTQPRALLVLVLSCVRRLHAGRAPRGGPPPRGGPITGPKAKQSLGQNFLQDVGLARQIAASLPEDATGGERVNALGPGQGAISGHLLKRYPSMTAVEIDERMIEHLSSTLPGLTVKHGSATEIVPSRAEHRILSSELLQLHARRRRPSDRMPALLQHGLRVVRHMAYIRS